MSTHDRPESARQPRALAFPSPPNPNGNLHLGHLSGPFLASDIYIRHRRMLGENAHMVMGTDDNQIWTALKAEQLGWEPQRTADHYAAEIERTLSEAGLNVSHYYRPNDSVHHHPLVEDFVRKLHDAGHLIAAESDALFDPDSGDYLFEPYAGGICPHCPDTTYANGCETCCLPNRGVDLGKPFVKATGKTPEIRKVRRLAFPLEPHRAFLEGYLQGIDLNPLHRALLQRMFDSELPEVIASHLTTWGIPVPLPGFDGQVVSAWVEMLPGYLAASASLADELGLEGGYRAFWAGGADHVVQTFGLDNGWNHALIYPALLHAYDPSLVPPKAFLVNQFYRLEGEKFSTSRGHAIWVDEAVEAHGADVVRLFVSYTAPEVEQSNFARKEFRRFVNEELRGRWQSWLADLQKRLTAADLDSAPPLDTLDKSQERFAQRMQQILEDASEAYSTTGFSPQRAVRCATRLVYEARHFALAQSGWRQVPSGAGRWHTALGLELAAARCLSLLLAPLAPGFAQQLHACLGYPGEVAEASWPSGAEPLPSGQALSSLACEFFAYEGENEG